MRGTLLVACAAVLASGEPANLLPGSGFEGSLAWWIPRATPCQAVEGDAAQGRWFLRATGKGFIHSQPLGLEGGKTYTISGWARAAGGSGTLAITIHPTPRQAGMPPFAIGRGGGAAKPWKNPALTAAWQRFSATMTLPDYTQEKHEFRSPWWWDFRSWWLFLEGPASGWDVDGLAITLGNEAPAAWVPHRPVEVAVDIVNLPGYVPAANLFPSGADLEAVASLHHAGSQELSAKLVWELTDYAGARVFERSEVPVTIPAGATVRVERRQRLLGSGLCLLRARVLAADGSELGACQAPATSLPHPQAAATLDGGARFGGTYVVGQGPDGHMNAIAQQLGLRWTRWLPMLNWGTVQKDGPESWNFQDAMVDAQQARGIGQNVVLHSAPPAWAKGSHPHLAKDMESWKADDPRWADLAQQTAWDRYVAGMVKRFPGPGHVMEVINEPQFGKWDPAIHYRFVERTSRLIRSLDAKARVMVNSVNGFDGITKDFARRGGGELVDIVSFHNYTNGPFASAETIRAFRGAFRRKDGSEPEIWFNEGWTWTPSSRASAVPGMRSDRPAPSVADMFVRSHAETFSAGMDCMIYFNMAYSRHGRSWWDWGGDGTEMWDDHNEPTVAVPALNVLTHHLGSSEPCAAIRHEQAWLHVFHDRAHRRGVIIAWGVKPDAVVPLPVAGLQATDIMGNAVPMAGNQLQLAVSGRPLYLWKDGVSGQDLARALQPLQMPPMSGEPGVVTAPLDWMQREATGNPYLVDGKPLWEFGRLLGPLDRVASYRTLRQWQPDGPTWSDAEGGQGGQPGAKLDGDGRIQLSTRGAITDGRSALVIFHAPEAGTWNLRGRVQMNRWEGSAAGTMLVQLLNSEQGEVQELARIELVSNRTWQDLLVEAIELRAGQRVAIVFVLRGGGGATGMIEGVRWQRR